MDISTTAITLFNKIVITYFTVISTRWMEPQSTVYHLLV